MLAVTVVAMALQRNLFSVVVLFTIYSFVMATLLVALDAVDVAMTEAAVGAGVSTVLLLGALYLTGAREAKRMQRPFWPLAPLLSCPLLIPQAPSASSGTRIIAPRIFTSLAVLHA